MARPPRSPSNSGAPNDQLRQPQVQQTSEARGYARARQNLDSECMTMGNGVRGGGSGRCARPPLSPAIRSYLSGLRQWRSEEHTSELQSPDHLVCRLLLEKKKKKQKKTHKIDKSANIRC